MINREEKRNEERRLKQNLLAEILPQKGNPSGDAITEKRK